MKKKARIIFFIIILFTTFFFFKKNETDKNEVSLKNQNIKTDKPQTLSLNKNKDMSETDKTASSQSIKAEDKNQFIIDDSTLPFFKSLEQLFPESKNLYEYLDKVEEYLLSKYPAKKAEKIFSTYKAYLLCELDVSEKIDASKLGSNNPEKIIEILMEIQEFRKARMGDEIAEALFDKKVKSTEYNIKKNSIIHNSDMYGLEKEEALRVLNQEMFSQNQGYLSSNPTPYDRYQQKLNIYQKDLKELSSKDDYELMIKNFRKEFFDGKAIKRIEALEKKKSIKKEAENLYYKKEKEILSSNDIDEDTKKEMIKELQDETFGNDAQKFRDRLDLRVKTKN